MAIYFFNKFFLSKILYKSIDSIGSFDSWKAIKKSYIIAISINYEFHCASKEEQPRKEMRRKLTSKK